MLYTKPNGLKYTDMCIFFDENFYSKDRDDETCYKYMYLIYHMLACKKKYFHNYNDYDSFAQFAATTIYIRYLKKQQDGLPPIKSILNYAKATVYPLKVMYQRQEFKDIPELTEDNAIKSSVLLNQMREQVQYDYSAGLMESIEEVLSGVPKLIEKVVLDTPYKDNEIMTTRLIMSCLITLLKSFTLSEMGLERLQRADVKGDSRKLILINNVYAREREESLSLWNLDSSYADYIKVLTNKIRKMLAEEISELTNSYTLPTEVVDAILSSAWDVSSHTNNSNNDNGEGSTE